MANGTVYRRDDRKKPWVVHVSWHEGDRRRQDFVAPTDLRVRDFVDTWLHALETQGRTVSTVTG